MIANKQTVAVDTLPGEESPWSARLRWGVIILAAINLAWAVRGLLQTFVPWDPDLMPVITTGCEEESLFSIWKFTKGEPVYSNPSAVPFAVSYFNWLFYWFYGAVTKCFLFAFNLSDGWLPVITRGITLGIIVGCVGVTSAIIQEAELWPSGLNRAAKLSLVSLCYFNELFQEWIATTRPDLGALLCDLIGLWFALRYFRRGKLWRLAAAVLCCYAAWAFKYNFVAVVTGLCLVLALTGRRRELLFVVSVSFLLYGLTFGLGSSFYRFSILATSKHSIYTFAQGWEVLRTAFGLAPHLAIASAALLGTVLLRRQLAWDASRLLLLLAGVTSWGLMLSAATKHGSNYNYLFEPSVLGFVWLLSLYQAPKPERGALCWLRMALPLALFAFFAASVQQAFVATADWRYRTRLAEAQTSRQRLSIVKRRPEWDELRHSLAAMPAPILVTDRHYNLPWVQSRAPHFVVAYNYSADRDAGRTYEGGGLAGLIRDGYFQTIVTPVKPSTNSQMTVATTASKFGIDGQPLDRYVLHHADFHFEYYVIRPEEPYNQYSAR